MPKPHTLYYQPNTANTPKITLKDDKKLNLIFTGQPHMELTPMAKDKFTVDFWEGYAVEFTCNEKGEIIEMEYIS